MAEFTKILFNNNDNIEKYGGFQHSSSFLDKISFISNPNLNNPNNSEMNGGNSTIDNMAEIVGGFPIVSNNQYDNNSLIELSTTSIGGKSIEGLSNLKHLYVPPGLVVYSYKCDRREHNEPIYNKPIETISDDKFDKLFNSLINNSKKNNKTKVNKLKKNNENKNTKKIIK